MSFLKNLVGEVSKDLLPKLGEGVEKIQIYFSKIFKDVDAHILKAQNLLQSMKHQLNYYLAERDRIQSQLNEKEREIARLNREINGLSENVTLTEYHQVMQEISLKMDELFSIQKQYLSIDSKINVYEVKIAQLEQEKLDLEKERKDLRRQYDKVYQDYMDRDERLKALSKEISSLREKEKEYRTLLESSVSKEEFDHLLAQLHELQLDYSIKEEERKSIQLELESLKDTKARLETELLQKTMQINHQTKELQEKEKQLNQEMHERKLVQNTLVEFEENLKQQNQQFEKLQQSIQEKEKLRAEIEVQLQNVSQEKKHLEEAYKKEYIKLSEYVDEIEILEKQLEEKQIENINSMNQYDNLKILSEEERKILEREYEPRFEQMYPNMVFNPRFFQEFFYLTVSERIKVESKIAQFCYQYETASSQIRPNTVKTKKGFIAELPFSAQGRIYFRKKDNMTYIYRLNRVKNEQPFVIHWLQENIL